MTGADVLVVDDAPEFTTVVATILRNAGHQVRTAASLAEAMTALARATPDLVVLDLGLPDGDGLDLCQAIRERSSTYVLVLTGRATEDDMVRGFRLGADDYVTKPFSARMLVARVEALLRRPRGDDPVAAHRTIGDLVIDTRTREVQLRGAPLELTRIEFDLLDALTEDPAAVRTRRELLDRVWGEGRIGDDHVVDVHVANLRKKIDAGGTRSRVRTVRGVGYSITT